MRIAGLAVSTLMITAACGPAMNPTVNPIGWANAVTAATSATGPIVSTTERGTATTRDAVAATDREAPAHHSLDITAFGGVVTEFGTYRGAVSIENTSNRWIEVVGLKLEVLAEGIIIDVVHLNFIFSEEPLFLAPGSNWFAIETYNPGTPDEIQGSTGDTRFADPPGGFAVSGLAVETFGAWDTIIGRVDSAWPEDLYNVSVHISFLADGIPVFGMTAPINRLRPGGAAFFEATTLSRDIDPSWDIEVTVVPH